MFSDQLCPLVDCVLCSVQESEDIVSWHHKVQSRLKEITTSPTDYHSVLHTIQQLQVCVCVCVCVCVYVCVHVLA